MSLCTYGVGGDTLGHLAGGVYLGAVPLAHALHHALADGLDIQAAVLRPRQARLPLLANLDT